MNKLKKKPTTGFIDYLDEFEKDESISCHWWNNAFFSAHYHNYYEIFLVSSGKTMHFLNGEPAEIHSRTMNIIRPSDVHQAVQIGRETCQHFNVAATADIFRNACDFLSPRLYGTINAAQSITFVLSIQEFDYFIRLANKIHSINAQSSERRDIKMLYEKQLLTYSLALFLEKTYRKLEYPQWFEELLQKINSPEYIACKISDIYKMSNYSAPSLVKYFKLYTNETITAHLQKMKVNYACNLLETTNMTTLEIAGRVGYDSLSHFNTLFKKITGCTPVEYKKVFRRKQVSAEN